MTRSRRIARLFRLALGRRTSGADADEELELHVLLRTEELVATGLSPTAARRKAESALGDRRRIRSELDAIDAASGRETRRRERLDAWWRDLRLGVRSLAGDPWFTAGAAAIIVLAVGLNAVIFSALNSAFLRPLPYPDADRIVLVYEVGHAGNRMQVAGPNAADWRRLSKSIESLAVFADADAALVDGDEPEYVHVAAAGRELLAVLGVSPVLGRWFAPEETVEGGPAAAVLGEGLWRRRYGGSPAVLGRVVKIAGISLTVIGVLPESATFPNGTQLWISAERNGGGTGGARTAHNWLVTARLRPGVEQGAAEAELGRLTRQLTETFPATDEFVGQGAQVVSLRESQLGGHRSFLFLVQAAALLILVIAAVNLTNLLLVRATRQRGEVAVRAALGAGRNDIVRRFLLEAIVLTTASGALGVVAAYPLRPVLHRILTRFLPLLPEPQIDLRALLVCLVGSALVGAAASAVPAARAAREDPSRVLSGSGAARVTAHHPIMNGLITLEIALALVLLAGAGLLVKSLVNLGRVRAGFDPVGRAVLRVPSDFAADSDGTAPAVTIGRIDRLLAAVRGAPSVRAAVMTISVPLEDRGANAGVEIAGSAFPAGEGPSAEFRIVSPGYFAAMGIPLASGRDFTDQDDLGAPRLAIVSQAFADRFLAGRDPIGIRLRFAGMQSGAEPWATVAGVVGDVRHRSLQQRPDPEVFFSYRQRAPTSRNFSIIAVARGEAALALRDLRPVFAREAPNAPYRGFPLESALAEGLGLPRMRSSVLAVFALLAVALAAAGIFGVVAFTVAQRTREIGLRLALGSARGAAVRSAMRLVLAPVGLGLGLGLVGALLVGRLVRAFLFDTGPEDPVVLVLAAIAMAAVSLLASYLPARRAARIEPIVALRS